jgi:hypothetical protein
LKESTATILAAALVGAGVWWIVRANRAAAAPPPTAPADTEDELANALDRFGLTETCAEIMTAAGPGAGLTCSGLVSAKRLWDKVFNSGCSTKAPGDLAARIIVNDGLNGPCAYATVGKSLWCAEAQAGTAASAWRRGDTRGGGGSVLPRNPTRRDAPTEDDMRRDPTGWIERMPPAASAVGFGKTVPSGWLCVAYRNGCVPMPGFPAAWGKCAKGTRPLRGGDSGSPNPSTSKVGRTSTSLFEAWLGPRAAAYLRGTVVDHRTR